MTHAEDSLPPEPQEQDTHDATPYEPPQVQSVKLSDEAAESLT